MPPAPKKPSARPAIPNLIVKEIPEFHSFQLSSLIQEHPGLAQQTSIGMEWYEDRHGTGGLNPPISLSILYIGT
jgi:hypothetical protein